MATDLTNKIFGHLYVLGLDTDKSEKMLARSYWLCECNCEKHTTKSIRGDHLTSGETISCGCLQKKKSGRKAIDLTNQRFGRLIAIEKTETTDTSGHVFWKCQCDCGNITEVSGASLRNGDTKSCGCLKHDVLSELFTKLGSEHKIDISNQKFGKLLVRKDSGKRTESGQILWECECECGNIILIQTSNIKNGHTISCGCIGKSKNEEKIQSLLNENHIEYCQQYNIVDKLRADFFIQNKYVIEYDGEQHFLYKDNNGWNNKENFEKTRERDLIKNKYCFDNNIPLIRIPYNADYTIDDLKLETTRFLLTPENEKEYYESRR